MERLNKKVLTLFLKKTQACCSFYLVWYKLFQSDGAMTEKARFP